MKAIEITQPLEIKCVERKVPVRKTGHALIQIKAMGICGSDVSAYKGKNPMVKYPLIIGHELAGVVLEIDENAQGIKPGDKVVLDPYVFCGECYPCSLGRTNCCTSLKVLGTQIDGGMQEIVSHPVHLLHKMPPNLNWEYAPISETLCISLHSIRRLEVKRGEVVAIFGAGPVGFLAALLCKDLGATPILIDIVQKRLDLAKQHGITYTINSNTENLILRMEEITKGQMAHAVLEASGSNEAVQKALDIVSFAGRVVYTGWPKGDTLLNTSIITKKELDVRGSRTANREFADSLTFLASGRINAAAILTDTCTIDNIPDRIKELTEHPESHIKIVALLD